MVFSATFKNISFISWQPVLLVEETRIPGENHRPVRQTLSQNVVSSTPRRERGSNSQLKSFFHTQGPYLLILACVEMMVAPLNSVGKNQPSLSA